MLHFGGWECLSECVGHHVIGRAIIQLQCPLLNYPADPVVSHVDVLHACMVLVVVGEGNGGLVVREQDSSVLEQPKDLRQQAMNVMIHRTRYHTRLHLALLCICDMHALDATDGDALMARYN
jgi:hypothetical protein